MPGDWSRGVSGAILLGLWVVGVFVMTISDPFENAGNGFFGVWFCTFCSAGFLIQERLRVTAARNGRM